MLKILPIIPSRTSQKFDPLFFFIPTSSPNILVIFIVSVIITSMHNTDSDYYIGEQDIASADFSLEST